jgi:hypothetical protein
MTGRERILNLLSMAPLTYPYSAAHMSPGSPLLSCVWEEFQSCRCGCWDRPVCYPSLD